jgi:hypothetical protein
MRRCSIRGVLNDSERARVVEALRVWLDGHPEPDVPAFEIAQEHTPLSPRRIFSSVAENDRLGQQVLAILEYSIRRTSLEEVASDLEHFDTEPPPAAATGNELSV